MSLLLLLTQYMEKFESEVSQKVEQYGHIYGTRYHPCQIKQTVFKIYGEHTHKLRHQHCIPKTSQEKIIIVLVTVMKFSRNWSLLQNPDLIVYTLYRVIIILKKCLPQAKDRKISTAAVKLREILLLSLRVYNIIYIIRELTLD